MDISSITSIVVALISATGGILGAAMAVRRGNRENEVKDALREQRQSDRLDRIDEKYRTLSKKITELSKKVDVHNGYAEKFGEVAKSMAVMAKDIEFLKSKP